MAVSGRAFVRAIKDNLKGKGAARRLSNGRLAEVMDWGRESPSLIGKWDRGENEPGYRYTMEMAEKAGWLTPAALRALARAEAELAKEDGLKQAGRRSEPQGKPQREQESL